MRTYLALLADSLFFSINIAASNTFWTPLHFAIANQRIDVVKYLIRSCGARNDTTCFAFRNTPMHLAAKKNCEEILKVLKEVDHDLDAQNSIGQTPLHFTSM